MGPDRGKHLRNIAIVLGLALVVWLVPGGDTASRTISNLLGIIFIGGLLFLGYRLYMEHRETIFGLRSASAGSSTPRSRSRPSRWSPRADVGRGRRSERSCGSPSSALAVWGLV